MLKSDDSKTTSKTWGSMFKKMIFGESKAKTEEMSLEEVGFVFQEDSMRLTQNKVESPFTQEQTEQNPYLRYFCTKENPAYIS